jgi:hypothetical protein
MITIDFERTDGNYTFRDAIILPDDHALTEEQIEEIKDRRWSEWLKVLTSPPPALDQGAIDFLDPNNQVDKEVNNG